MKTVATNIEVYKFTKLPHSDCELFKRINYSKCFLSYNIKRYLKFLKLYILSGNISLNKVGRNVL